jgi:rubredoxin
LKHTCPNCGHKWEAPAPQQTNAGKTRWEGVSARKRSEAAKKAALARWSKKDTSTGKSGK